MNMTVSVRYRHNSYIFPTTGHNRALFTHNNLLATGNHVYTTDWSLQPYVDYQGFIRTYWDTFWGKLLQTPEIPFQF